MENNKKVLVIDDEPAVVETLKQLLSSNGYDVGTAGDGLEALAKLKNGLPHLIIADIMMPKMDGFAFYKELKKDKAHADIPVIIISARGKMADTFLAIGADVFLKKPYDSQELLNNIERLILPKGSAPKPKEPVSVVKEAIKDIPAPQSRPAVASGKKKALIFGDDEKTNHDMSEQLEKSGCCVTVVKEDGKLIAAVQEIQPEVVFLAINSAAQEPIDKIVARVSALIPKESKAEPGSSLTKKMAMVLYKIEEEVQGVKETSSDLVEIENILERCYEKGAAKYIGAYSSFAFLNKAREFLS